MSKRQLIIMVLCTAFIVVSSILHFRHPAYGEYRALVELMTKRQDEFERRVSVELLDKIREIVSSSPSSTPLASGLASDSSLDRAGSRSQPPDIIADYSFNLCGTRGTGLVVCALIDGWYYYQGDPYLDSVIVQLLPSCAILADGRKILPRTSSTPEKGNSPNDNA